MLNQVVKNSLLQKPALYTSMKPHLEGVKLISRVYTCITKLIYQS